jgi:hypothetical protein
MTLLVPVHRNRGILIKLTIVSIENSFNLYIILQLLLEKSSSSLQGGSVCLIG